MSKFAIEYAKILYELTRDLDDKEKLDKVLGEFIKYLHKQQALNKIDYIIEEFEKLVRREEKNEHLEITAARGLSEEVIESIKSAVDGDSKVEVKEDEDMIGGVIVKKGNTIIDGSVKTQLDKLKRKLL